METLQTVILVILGFIDTAAVPRILYCIFKCINEDEVRAYLKRIRHIVVFLILANCSWIIKTVVEHYFK